MIYRTALEILNYHMLSLEFSESEIANGNYDLMPVTGRLLYPHAPSRFRATSQLQFMLGCISRVPLVPFLIGNSCHLSRQKIAFHAKD